MLQWYDGYKAYAGWRPPNHGVAQFSTLDEAVWSIPLAWSFDLIRSTLTDSQQAEIVDKLLLPAADFLMERHFGGIHNFACWHNAAIGTIGAVTGSEELLAFAIDGRYGFHTQAREGIVADGLWFEGSFSYHFYTVAALLLLAKATANLPKWDLHRHPSLAAVLRAPVLCAYPDGSLPATNDCWYFTGLNDDCCHGVPKAPAFYEIGYAWFEEELFGQVLTRAYQHGPRESLDALLFGAHSVPAEGIPRASQRADAGHGLCNFTFATGRAGAASLLKQSSMPCSSMVGTAAATATQTSWHLTSMRRAAAMLRTWARPAMASTFFKAGTARRSAIILMILGGLSQPPGAGREHCLSRPMGPFQIADATMEWGERCRRPK